MMSRIVADEVLKYLPAFTSQNDEDIMEESLNVFSMRS